MKLFSAKWCVNCTPVKDLIDSDPLIKDKIKIIDVDKEPDLVAKHSIRGIPTLVLGDGTPNITGEFKIRSFLKTYFNQIPTAKGTID